MTEYYLILRNEGQESYKIDEPINYTPQDGTRIKFTSEMNHQIDKIDYHYKKYGFENRISLLVRNDAELDYFLLTKSEGTYGKNTSFEFTIFEPKTLINKQI